MQRLFSSWIKSCLAVAGLLLLVAPMAHAQSNFADLKGRYAAADAPLTRKDLLGTFLGRCFDSRSNEPIGMILMTVENYKEWTETKNEDQGPLYASSQKMVSDTWKMAAGQLTDSEWSPLPAESNDDISKASIDAYWNSPQAFIDGHLYPLTFRGVTESNGTVSSQSVTAINGKTIIRDLDVKQGQDGYFYVQKRIDPNSTYPNEAADQYCYFWEKLY